MTLAVKYLYRSVHHALYSGVKESLRLSGWLGGVPRSVPFGADAFTIKVESDPSKVDLDSNGVFYVPGDEMASMEEELGAGLESIDYTLSIHVFGEQMQTVYSVCSDIKSYFEDRFTYKPFDGSPPMLPNGMSLYPFQRDVLDMSQSSNPPVPVVGKMYLISCEYRIEEMNNDKWGVVRVGVRVYG